MKISALFDRVNNRLANTGYVTWSEPFLRSAYDEAVSAVLTVLPVGYTETADLPLAAGTQQVLPATATALLGAIGNATAGGAAGDPVEETGDMALFRSERAYLSDRVYTATSYQVLRVYIDPMDPRGYHVLPPVPASYAGALRARVGARPAAPDWNADPDFPLLDGFDLAVQEHMLYVAFGRDDDTSPGYARAQTHLGGRDRELQRLAALLGVSAVGLQVTEAARQ